MPEEKKGGTYIPEWTWKLLQSLLLAAVLGGYGMFYSMNSDIAELKLQRAQETEKLAKLEAEIAASKASRDSIKTSLTKIETELPYIKEGIGELKALLTR